MSMVVLVLGELAFVAFVLWLAVPFLRDRARQRAELQRAIVQRFATADEFVTFLGTEPGRRFQASLSGRPFGVLTRVLAGVQVGITLTSLGLALAGVWFVVKDDDVLVVAALAFGLGLGFLAAATASRRLSRRWGLGPDGNPAS